MGRYHITNQDRKARPIYISGILCHSYREGWRLMQELVGPEISYWNLYYAVRSKKTCLFGVVISRFAPNEEPVRLKPPTERKPCSGPLIRRRDDDFPGILH